MNNSQRKTICVIGAGPSGLTCIKQCRDEGLDVVCYERFSALGGLWHYKDQVKDGITSIALNTVSNTSKEFSGFSDFPPPKHFPNYMPHPVMLEYFRLYAAKFSLEQHIQFNKKVLNVTYADDYDETGRWAVTTEDVHTKQQKTVIFDGVAVATGHHVLPMMPKFPGQEKFRGNIQHTHTFKHPKGMEGKRVVVIGIGNSGGDAAVDAATVASAVFLSTRRGCWVRSRTGAFGLPNEIYLATRAVDLLVSVLPTSLVNFFYETQLNINMDHQKYGLRPGHRFLSQHPMINDLLPNYILSGKVTMKRNVLEFTETGVIFEGESEVTEVDEVIFATGYEWTIPFIDTSIIDFSNNKMNLFKNMFQANLRHPQTLALISLAQPSGPIHLLAEMQSRWFARLMNGKVKLPSKSEMNQVTKEDKKIIKNMYYESPRHNLELLYVPYMKYVASVIGCAPSLTKYALTDPQLLYHLVFGLFTAYQFRLEGPFSWAGARDAIINTPERIKAGFVENTPPIITPTNNGAATALSEDSHDN